MTIYYRYDSHVLLFAWSCFLYCLCWKPLSRSSSVKYHSLNIFSVFFSLLLNSQLLNFLSSLFSPCSPVIPPPCFTPPISIKANSFVSLPTLISTPSPDHCIWHWILPSPSVSSNLFLHFHWARLKAVLSAPQSVMLLRQQHRYKGGPRSPVHICLVFFFKDMLQSWGWVSHHKGLTSQLFPLVSSQYMLPLKKLCFCCQVWKTSKNHSEFRYK